jgi:histone acetyltransferase HTATIP
MQMLKTQRNNHILCITEAAKDAYFKSQKKVRRKIDPNCLQWKPPYFTRDQLRAWAY